MKKLVWLALVSGLALTVYGQGQVSMNSLHGTGVLRFFNTETGQLAGSAADGGVGTIYHVGLYWAADQETLMSGGGSIAGSLAWLSTGASPAAVLSSTGGGARTIVENAVPRLALTYFQLRAWTGAYQTYEDAKRLGDANTLISQWDPAAPGFAIIRSAIPQQSSTAGIPNIPWGGSAAAPVLVNLIPVPEPSTLALVGLGLMGLIFIRRRK